MFINIQVLCMYRQEENKLTNKKLLGALAASAASIYSQTEAEAGIIHINNDPVISDTAVGGSAGWDIDGDTIAEATLINENGNNGTKYAMDLHAVGTVSNRQASFVVTNVTNTNKLIALTNQMQVSASKQFDPEVFSVFDHGSMKNVVGFTSGSPGYFGFKFVNTPNGNATHYGWAKATLTNGGTFGTFEISEWAYNDVAGGSITVGDTGSVSTGDVPEPSSFAITGLGLLAAGASGVRRYRRDRKQKVA